MFLFTAVYSFIDLAKSLLTLDGSRFLLSEWFTQDPVEAFLGKQRARGGRSDNPTAKRFIENTQAIRVSRSLALGGSSSVKRSLDFDVDKLCEKLPGFLNHSTVPFSPNLFHMHIIIYSVLRTM